jgi:hypothetical protein
MYNHSPEVNIHVQFMFFQMLNLEKLSISHDLLSGCSPHEVMAVPTEIAHWLQFSHVRDLILDD